MAKRQPADSPIASCFDCANKPTERLEEMFVGAGQTERIKLGQRPAERAVFRKLHGVAHGFFEPVRGIGKEFKVGLLAQGRRPAWVRISSDASPTSPDLKSTIGIAIKIFGVPDSDSLGEPGETADLVMQNYPVFFVDDAKTMCEFTYAGVVEGDYDSYLSAHPKTRDILNAMAKVEGSVLTTTYWAILPFRCGEEIVKYRLDPETPPENVADRAPDYLETDMANRLAKRDYRFRLMIQRRTNTRTMPLDRATVEWPESQSPFEHVADLVLPQQDILARGQSDYGQALAFNIWRVPAVNAPVAESSIAAARKIVYAAGARLRHTANGQPLLDPAEPRAVAPSPVDDDDCIVKAVIHPAIGVARVGTSKTEFFIGPEVPDPPAQPLGFYRDKSGALKRQAARFRIYGVNMKGRIIRELTGPEAKAEITWSVQLANTKAAWYGFQLALDIPEAVSAPPTTLRNAGIADRSKLAITPRQQSVGGRNAKPKAFDDGAFMGKKVYLGEIHTDEAGRLIVLGGHGHSASCDGSRAITFANNEGWHDDVSDGPVTAKVMLEGRAIDVTPAWVVVAPPDFAPRRKSVRTMWDLMRDGAIAAGLLAQPERPSFTREIKPIFDRLAGLQWVNAGFAAGFGWRGVFDVQSPSVVARLADDGPASADFRKAVVNQFRRYTVDSWSPKPWPWVYGDAMNVPAAQTPRQMSMIGDTQLWCLDQWARGNFVADYDPHHVPPATIDEVPLVEQGDTLTRAALEFCLADAFHPGCEMTWPVRAASMYMAPFRFKHAPEGWVAPSPSEVLTSDSISLPSGPLAAQQAGGITRWMAVPWQTDTASCRSGYDKSYDPYLPTFWPARVPNQVLTKEDYEIAVDERKPRQERLAAFAYRADFFAPLGTTGYTDQINNMIAHYDHLGVVEERDGPGDGLLPAKIEVEDRHTPIPAKAEVRKVAVTQSRPADASDEWSQIEKVRRFPGGLLR